MMKKKKQSNSQSSNKINLEPSQDSSPSPRLLSIFRSKLASGKDLKHMFRGMRSKTIPGLSSQSRIVRCPKCQRLVQEPLNATSYKCGGCDSILQANRWALEGNSKTIPEALLSSENRSFKTKGEFEEGGSKTIARNTHREYNARAPPSVQRSHSETVYKHETSDIRIEWMRRADEFSVNSDSDAFASARSSPYYSNASEWTPHEGRYKDQPRIPSPSSAYEYDYNSPFTGSQASANEQSYNHHQPKQYGREREDWFQESSVASPGETSDGKYYHWSNLQYHNLYESNSFAAPHRSVYSERSYQAAAAPHRSQSDSSSEKSSLRDKRRYVRERKKPVVKRHIVPSAGGAPFATCSYCLELLHLPQVSLLGKQVRCGSCSGVFNFSTREKADNVADETIHQESDSEAHEDIYPETSHLPCLNNDSGDVICKSIDDVILSRNLETFENRRNITSEYLASKLEALQPQLKPLVQQRSKESTIGVNSRLHLKQYQEAHSEKLTEMDKNISEKIEYHLEEFRYMKNEMVEDGKSSEVAVYNNERMSESSAEAESVTEKPVSHSAEPINMNEYGGKRIWGEVIGGEPELHLEKSRYYGDSTCDNSSSNGETFEDIAVKEDIELMSNTFLVATSATPESPLKYKSQSFIGHSDQSGEATVTLSRIHEEQSKLEYDNLSETVGSAFGTLKPVYLEGSGYAGERTWVETMEDRAVLHLEEYESNYENYSNPLECIAPTSSMHEYELGTTLEPDKDADGRSEERAVVHESQDAKPERSQYDYEDSSGRQELSNTVSDIVRSELQETLEPGKMVGVGSVVSPEKASETIIGEPGEEKSVSHQMAPQNDNVANSYGTVGQVYLEGSRYASERTPVQTMEDGAVMQLEEYQSKPYEWTSEGAPTFRLHEYELETMPEPDQDTISSSRDSFNSAVSHETLKLGVLVEDGPSPHLEKYKSELNLNSEETVEWTSERALTFNLREYELGTMLEAKKDADGRSESSSSGSFDDHSKVRALVHKEDPYLVNDSRTDALQLGEMVEDGSSLHLEETFEWTSGRTLTFRLHENETMDLEEALEPMDDRFRLCPNDILDQERMMFHLDMSQDKQENPRQGNTQEDVPASSSTVSSKDHKSMAEVDSESDEEILRGHLKRSLTENEKSGGLTSEPYMEPSEIVGLRHALYQTQSSPLRSPLTSPIHTPIGSPLHYMMSSPITSPIHSRIVSPLRSPINTSGSLSDVLFFGKRS